VHDYKPPKPRRRPAEPIPDDGEVPALDPAVAEALRRLRERFGDAVSMAGSGARGVVTLRYESADQLEDVLDAMLD